MVGLPSICCTVWYRFHFEIKCWLRVLQSYPLLSMLLNAFIWSQLQMIFIFFIFFPEFSTISAINTSTQFSIQKTIENHQTIHFLNVYPTFDIWETIPLIPINWPNLTKRCSFMKTYSRTSGRLGGWEPHPTCSRHGDTGYPSLAWAFSHPSMRLLSSVTTTNFYHFIKSKNSFSEDKSHHCIISCMPSKAQHTVSPCSSSNFKSQ